MKKYLLPIIKKAFKSVISYTLVAAMAVPAAPVLSNVVAVKASEVQIGSTVTVPDPIVSYDFEGGIKDLMSDDKFEITKSNEVYIQKTAEEAGAFDKIDANGLVYTGSGDTTRYTKTLISNQPTTAYDDEKGTVLKLGNAVTIPAIKKTQSASITNDATGTSTLDSQIPVSSNAVQPAYTVYSELKISNPFAGLADELQEYDELYDLTRENGGLKRFGNKYSPYWQKGLTISYWIKVPANQDGTYKNSSVLRWELDNQNYYQADDYGKYLTCKKYDIEYAKLSDEVKNSCNESGVPTDSAFYFEYQDVNGTKPFIHTDAEGNSGPVYTAATTSASGMAHYFFSNPKYVQGFTQNSDGTYARLDYYAAYYNNYHFLPTEITAEEYNKLTPEEITSRNIIKQEFCEASRYMEIGNSSIRFAEEDGEFQIDADDSTFWVCDNGSGAVANPNDQTYYGKKPIEGMMNRDVFFMNSWRESANTKTFDYASSLYQAVSPVTKFATTTDAGGNECTTSIKNGSVNTWQHVTMTLQNDWVEFYINGELVDVRANYSTRSNGNTSLAITDEFKRLNKGAGLRYGYGSEKQVGTIFYGNYVARLFMDWISDPDAVLSIGGTGEDAATYNCSTKASEFEIDDLTFYNQVLTDAQIKAAYEASAAKMNPEYNVLSNGAVELDSAVPSVTGAVSTISDTIIDASGKSQSVTALKVAENKKVSTNTSAKITNPFAGKNLEGATICYWMKQGERAGTTEGSTAMATAGLTFYDEAKEVYNPKNPANSGEASSILYTKTDGTIQFTEAYSVKSISTSLDNRFYSFATDAAATALKESADQWHCYVLTMNNGGVKLYVDGKLVENAYQGASTGPRFLDGYFKRVADETDFKTKYGVYGGTNNQGATTLMDFITYEDTCLYLGYLPAETGYENTNPTYYANMIYYDEELDADQVMELYETPEPTPTVAPTATPEPTPTVAPTATPEPIAKVSKPVADLPSRSYNAGQSVTLSTDTEGAKIYYTLDGSMPTRLSCLYTGKIDIMQSVLLKTIAVKDGMEDSEVAEYSYEIIYTTPSPSVTPEPTSSPSVILGDMNGDNIVMLDDAQMILKMALNITSYNDEQQVIADLDSDKSISLSDAQIALKKALNIIE